ALSVIDALRNQPSHGYIFGVRIVLSLLLGGCSLYFDKPAASDASAADGQATPDPNVIERPCLRAMAPFDLMVGASAHPTHLFITYVCEGGAIIETITFDGNAFGGGMARGDFQDSSNRLVALPHLAPTPILMISEHRPELWLFTYSGGQRMSFERA